MDLVEETERVKTVLRSANLLHTSAVAEAAGLNVVTTGVILARLRRQGKAICFHPRRTNVLQEKLWMSVS
jgi:hypothetical protein